MAALAASLLALVLAWTGPVAALADRALFSAHAARLLLLAEVWAPLFLLGLPASLVGRLAATRAGGAVMRLARLRPAPAVAGLLFVAHILAWQSPALFARAQASPVLRSVELVLLMVAALGMWWFVCAPLAGAGRLREPAAMAYLFVLGAPLQAMAAWITLSTRRLYPGYGDASLAHGLAPLQDQQLGGLILWIPGGVILLFAITLLWFHWAARPENRRGGHGQGPDAGGDAEPPLSIPGDPAAG